MVVGSCCCIALVAKIITGKGEASCVRIQLRAGRRVEAGRRWPKAGRGPPLFSLPQNHNRTLNMFKLRKKLS